MIHPGYMHGKDTEQRPSSIGLNKYQTYPLGDHTFSKCHLHKKGLEIQRQPKNPRAGDIHAEQQKSQSLIAVIVSACSTIVALSLTL